MKAKDALIQESITLPVEVRDRLVKNIQISFQFADGQMHHVIPSKPIATKLASDCLKTIRHGWKTYVNWNFLEDKDIEI